MWLQPVWNAMLAPVVFIVLRSWDILWDVRERGR